MPSRASASMIGWEGRSLCAMSTKILKKNVRVGSKISSNNGKHLKTFLVTPLQEEQIGKCGWWWWTSTLLSDMKTSKCSVLKIHSSSTPKWTAQRHKWHLCKSAIISSGFAPALHPPFQREFLYSLLSNCLQSVQRNPLGAIWASYFLLMQVSGSSAFPEVGRRIPGRTSGQETDLSCGHKHVSVGKQMCFLSQHLFKKQCQDKGRYGFMLDRIRGILGVVGFHRCGSGEKRNMGVFGGFCAFSGSLGGKSSATVSGTQKPGRGPRYSHFYHM